MRFQGMLSNLRVNVPWARMTKPFISTHLIQQFKSSSSKHQVASKPNIFFVSFFCSSYGHLLQIGSSSLAILLVQIKQRSQEKVFLCKYFMKKSLLVPRFEPANRPTELSCQQPSLKLFHVLQAVGLCRAVASCSGQEASTLGYLSEAEDKWPKSRLELDQSLYGLKELCSHHSLHYCPILEGLLG